MIFLEPRPIQNVLLQHVVRAGALGRVPGFFGCEVDGQIVGVLMVGASGGASIEVRHADAFAPLAEWAYRLSVPPRHLTGAEDVTQPFWQEYAKWPGAELIWERRERVYVISRVAGTPSFERTLGTVAVRRAREHEIDAIVENSARQHIEDLKEDRRAMDPLGFRSRHLGEIRDGHWWVLCERDRIVFQTHVGPRNEAVVQLGGVFTPPELRCLGHASRGMRALVAQLLRDHPGVSLFCDESNAVACRLYERVGFERRFYNHSYLLRVQRRTAYL